MLESFIGALIGGTFTLTGVLYAYSLQEYNQKVIENEQLNDFLKGISDDVSCLWEFYLLTVGNRIESLTEGDAANFYYLADQDYLAYYHANILMVNRINSEDLRLAIHIAYLSIKSHLDTLKINADTIDKVSKAKEIQILNPSERSKQNFKSIENFFISYGKEVKNSHEQLRKSINRLEKELSLVSTSNKPVRPKLFSIIYMKPLFQIIVPILLIFALAA